MKLNELLDQYRQMPTAKRRLLLIMPAALFLLALMTAPHSPSAAPLDAATPSTSAVSDCAVTKLRMSIFGRSLMSYDWQSGNCINITARRVNQ